MTTRMQTAYSLEDIERAISVEDANIVRMQQAVSDCIRKKGELMEIKKELGKRSKDAENSVIIVPRP